MQSMRSSNIEKRVLVIEDLPDVGAWLADRLSQEGCIPLLVDGCDIEASVKEFARFKPNVVVLDRDLGSDPKGGDELARRFRESAAAIRRQAQQISMGNPDARYEPYIILHTAYPGGDYYLRDQNLVDETVSRSLQDFQDLLARIRYGLRSGATPSAPGRRPLHIVVGADKLGNGGWMYELESGRFRPHGAGTGERADLVVLQGNQKIVFDALATRIAQPCSVDYLLDTLERSGWTPSGEDREPAVYLRDFVYELRLKLKRLALDPDHVLPSAQQRGPFTYYTLFGFNIQ